MDDPGNFASYDVDVIAKHDPDTIPLLDAPIGSAFIRTEHGFILDAGSVHPNSLVLDGAARLTHGDVSTRSGLTDW
jgi:hypothetical protein